jgi:Superinfection immunity protein
MLAYFSLSVASANSLPAFDNSWLIAGSLPTIYFAPALVAFFRRQQNRWFILALNFLFGWTIVGWIICLAWAARAPSGEPVPIVQTVPQVSPGRRNLFPREPGNHFTPPGPNVSESAPFPAEGLFPGARSLKMVFFRLAVAAISLAVVAGVTASQWKNTNPSAVSQPRHHINHVPLIRNIDPYAPSPPGAASSQRRYATPAVRSHEGYY